MNDSFRTPPARGAAQFRPAPVVVAKPAAEPPREKERNDRGGAMPSQVLPQTAPASPRMAPPPLPTLRVTPPAAPQFPPAEVSPPTPRAQPAAPPIPPVRVRPPASVAPVVTQPAATPAPAPTVAAPVTQISQKVATAGGETRGPLRCSIVWNDKDYDDADWDLHCYLPNGVPIGYFRKYAGGGELDVDIRHPTRGTTAVENIVFRSSRDMMVGTYVFFARLFDSRTTSHGFSGEIEVAGKIYPFRFKRRKLSTSPVEPVIWIAEVNYNGSGDFSVEVNDPLRVDVSYTPGPHGTRKLRR